MWNHRLVTNDEGVTEIREVLYDALGNVVGHRSAAAIHSPWDGGTPEESIEAQLKHMMLGLALPRLKVNSDPLIGGCLVRADSKPIPYPVRDAFNLPQEPSNG